MNINIENLFTKASQKNYISNELYAKYGVKKGLRNEDGTGVLIGLTRIADVVGYEKDEAGNKINTDGKLYYRNYEIKELIDILSKYPDNMYERACFLILFGYLPDEEEFNYFKEYLHNHYFLPDGFMVTNILRQPSINVMNKIQRALLMLYSEDDNADDSSPMNTLYQGLSIIAKLNAIMIYSYQAKIHILENKSLIIHPINKDLSIAQSILSLLRVDKQYTKEEARILDMLLVLHADHGSGNNSTFANLVVSSSGTDIYSSFVASIGSLKGPRHGGANIMCRNMMKSIISEIGLNASDDIMLDYIYRLLNKEFFDMSGLIYGFGHAVYTLSDPRCEILKTEVSSLAKEKDRLEEYDFYKRFEKNVKEYFVKYKNRQICANVDYYSGFVYDMLDIPEDLFTPLFVQSRSVGWLAHNIEHKLYCDRIIRPAGKFIKEDE